MWSSDPYERLTMDRVIDVLRNNDSASIFRQVNTNNDEVLTRDEFDTFSKCYAISFKEEDIDKLFYQIDEYRKNWFAMDVCIDLYLFHRTRT